MQIVEERVCGTFSAQYIKERLCNPNEIVLFTRIGTDNLAIIMDNTWGDTDPVIVMDVEHTVPLWKQSMQMQMGRMPSRTTSQRETRHVRWMNDTEIHGNMRFKVYRRIR